MAEGDNGINFMAMLNPQFAAQQQRFALQQQMAQQMMEQGSEQPPTAQLANPGGMVVRNSPSAGWDRMLEKGLGGFMQSKAIGDQMAAYQNLGTSNQQQDPNSMNQTELLHDMMARGSGTAEYQNRMAGSRKAAEESAIPRITPQGTYATVPVGGAPSASPQPLPWQQPQPNPASMATPARPAPQPSQTNVMPNPTANTPKPEDIPMAGDGKQLFSDLKSSPKPDPTGTPTWKPASTNTDVNQIKLNQDDLQKGNAAMASASQTLQQQKAVIDNLTDIYKGTQSGTLTMQHPEWINKLVALGIVTDPSTIHSVSEAQAAINNHILGAIGQIKDANSNMEGSPVRTFGSEIGAILDKGQSQINQPEALWTTLGEARGLIDHHLDMVNQWQIHGGSGNRLNGGTTMLPSQFIQKFNSEHDITPYTVLAHKNMPIFKGMAGNNDEIPSVGTISKGHKFLGGDPSQPESWSKLP